MIYTELFEWEEKIRKIFNEVDIELESKYGHLFPLHPSRAPAGTTSNPEFDGLFNIGAVYSPGFGSEKGEGYIIDVQILPSVDIPYEFKEKLLEEIVVLIQKKLDKAFLDKGFKVVSDGTVFKITGDLSLK